MLRPVAGCERLPVPAAPVPGASQQVSQPLWAQGLTAQGALGVCPAEAGELHRDRGDVLDGAGDAAGAAHVRHLGRPGLTLLSPQPHGSSAGEAGAGADTCWLPPFQ